MDKPFTKNATESQVRAITGPIDSHVRREAQKLVDHQKKDLSSFDISHIQDFSQGLKALALLEAGLIIPRNHCDQGCNSKGYFLKRGKRSIKDGEPEVDPITHKPVYKWEKTACGCIKQKMDPTNLKGIHYEDPTSKGKPSEKVSAPSHKPKRAAAKDTSRTGTGKTGTDKRSGKV